MQTRMYGTRLGIGGAILATCAFLGSLGPTQPALAAPADAGDTASITASAAIAEPHVHRRPHDMPVSSAREMTIPDGTALGPSHPLLLRDRCVAGSSRVAAEFG